MRSGRWSETEITKSLRTGNLKEAQYRARLERVKLDGEWAVLRRQLAPKPVGTLSDAEIWHLVAKWFVGAEGKNADPDITPVDRYEAEVDRTNLERWEIAAPGIFAETVKLLQEEGIELEPSSPAFLRLEQMLHRAALARCGDKLHRPLLHSDCQHDRHGRHPEERRPSECQEASGRLKRIQVDGLLFQHGQPISSR